MDGARGTSRGSRARTAPISSRCVSDTAFGATLTPMMNIGLSRWAGPMSSCADAADASAPQRARTMVETLLTVDLLGARGAEPRGNGRVQFANDAAAFDRVLDELELLGAVGAGAGVLRDLHEHELEVVEQALHRGVLLRRRCLQEARRRQEVACPLRDLRVDVASPGGGAERREHGLGADQMLNNC